MNEKSCIEYNNIFDDGFYNKNLNCMKKDEGERKAERNPAEWNSLLCGIVTEKRREQSEKYLSSLEVFK